ncbi:hypothetical protein DFH28DRAFT_1119617 [Melampsora americana]|nr:hypothetical protein DFH28DRAFT_1119617 [Melampsora americana]
MSNSFAQDFPSSATVPMETPCGSPKPDPTQKMDVSPWPAAAFAAPTFEAFAQACTSSFRLSNIQESGLFKLEFEGITKEEFECNISATAHVLCCQVNAPNVPKDARKLMEKAAQICESRIHDLRCGIHPLAIDGVKVIDLTGEGTPAPTQPHQSSCQGGSSSEYSRSHSSRKKQARLSLKRNEEDNLSDEQPLETGDNHGTTSAEHDDTLLEDVLLQERKKEALHNDPPICASYITSASAINPALITQPKPVSSTNQRRSTNTGNISNIPLSPAHDNSAAQSPVQPYTQTDSHTSPTRPAFCSATLPTNKHPASSTQTDLPQSSAATYSENPPASHSQPLIDDTTATTNKSASTFPLAQNHQSPPTGSSQNNSNNKDSTKNDTPEEQLAALDLDSMDADLPVSCLLPELDPSPATGTEYNIQNLFSSKRDVFVSAFKKFPICMTPAKYSEGCNLVLKLLELRLKHIPTIINPKYLLTKGFKFHETTMTGTAWLSELNQQGMPIIFLPLLLGPSY